MFVAIPFHIWKIKFLNCLKNKRKAGMQHNIEKMYFILAYAETECKYKKILLYLHRFPE